MYLILVSILAIQRMFEVFLGKRNLKRLEGKLLSPFNSTEHKQMIILHTSWFGALILEFHWYGQIVANPLLIFGCVILTLCQWIRWQSIRQIGEYWVPLPLSFKGQKRIKSGVYKWVDHPNYMIVVVEFFLVPFLGGCFGVMFIWSILNLIFLRRRILIEEKALSLLED